MGKTKVLIIGVILIGSLGTIGCSSTEDFKDGFNESYQSIVNKNMEGMYDTEKEAKEFADKLVTVGDNIVDNDVEVIEYINSEVDNIKTKIDELAEYTHPDAQLMIEGYTLMSEALIATRDGEIEKADIFIKQLNNKATEISEECRYE